MLTFIETAGKTPIKPAPGNRRILLLGIPTLWFLSWRCRTVESESITQRSMTLLRWIGRHETRLKAVIDGARMNRWANETDDRMNLQKTKNRLQRLPGFVQQMLPPKVCLVLPTDVVVAGRCDRSRAHRNAIRTKPARYFTICTTGQLKHPTILSKQFETIHVLSFFPDRNPDQSNTVRIMSESVQHWKQLWYNFVW